MNIVVMIDGETFSFNEHDLAFGYDYKGQNGYRQRCLLPGEALRALRSVASAAHASAQGRTARALKRIPKSGATKHVDIEELRRRT